MGTQENKQTAKEAYAAFGEGDAERAMAQLDESIEWTAVWVAAGLSAASGLIGAAWRRPAFGSREV